eukprot:TRINITY_DN124681_c0_g1_i1.p1 TRINITY_DN124681_c0_g1~~TRINITY_DN124681_c0_g1_i1.p1  ORF type:complete len:499 (+),score=66.15 TRINITY_DN124681_c0_g1_i1:88-1584(+)
MALPSRSWEYPLSVSDKHLRMYHLYQNEIESYGRHASAPLQTSAPNAARPRTNASRLSAPATTAGSSRSAAVTAARGSTQTAAVAQPSFVTHGQPAAAYAPAEPVSQQVGSVLVQLAPAMYMQPQPVQMQPVPAAFAAALQRPIPQLAARDRHSVGSCPFLWRIATAACVLLSFLACLGLIVISSASVDSFEDSAVVFNADCSEPLPRLQSFVEMDSLLEENMQAPVLMPPPAWMTLEQAGPFLKAEDGTLRSLEEAAVVRTVEKEAQVSLSVWLLLLGLSMLLGGSYLSWTHHRVEHKALAKEKGLSACRAVVEARSRDQGGQLVEEQRPVEKKADVAKAPPRSDSKERRSLDKDGLAAAKQTGKESSPSLKRRRLQGDESSSSSSRHFGSASSSSESLGSVCSVSSLSSTASSGRTASTAATASPARKRARAPPQTPSPPDECRRSARFKHLDAERKLRSMGFQETPRVRAALTARNGRVVDALDLLVVDDSMSRN